MQFFKLIKAAAAAVVFASTTCHALAAPSTAADVGVPPGLSMMPCPTSERSSRSATTPVPVRLEGCFNAVPQDSAAPARYFSLSCPADGSADSLPVYRDCGSDATCAECTDPGRNISSDTCFKSALEGMPLATATCAAGAIGARAWYDFITDAWDAVTGTVSAVVGFVVDATNTIVELITGDTYCKARKALRLKDADCKFTGKTISSGWPVVVTDGREYLCDDGVPMVKVEDVASSAIKIGYAVFEDLKC